MTQRKLLLDLVRAGGRFTYMNIFITNSDETPFLSVGNHIVCDINMLCIDLYHVQLYDVHVIAIILGLLKACK